MKEKLRRNLITYFVNGVDKGLNVDETLETTEYNGEVLIHGEYNLKRTEGYNNTDEGSINARIRYVEDERSKNIVIKTEYKGEKNYKPYEYETYTTFEIVSDMNGSIIHKTVLDMRTNEMKEVFYKTSALNEELDSYQRNCYDAINAYTADYEMTKIKKLK